LKKRLFSSPRAFEATLAEHLRTLHGRRDDQPVRASARLLQRELARADDDFAADEELETATHDSVRLATSQFAALSAAERTLLERLERWASEASKRPDSKAKLLLEHLAQTCKAAGEWNDTRVIVFTEYRATQQWLHGLLVNAGLGTE